MLGESTLEPFRLCALVRNDVSAIQDEESQVASKSSGKVCAVLRILSENGKIIRSLLTRSAVARLHLVIPDRHHERNRPPIRRHHLLTPIRQPTFPKSDVVEASIR